MASGMGLDLVTALSMSAALIFGEALAATVVALMYTGGTFLESFAEGRAPRKCVTYSPACRGPRRALTAACAGFLSTTSGLAIGCRSDRVMSSLWTGRSRAPGPSSAQTAPADADYFTGLRDRARGRQSK